MNIPKTLFITRYFPPRTGATAHILYHTLLGLPHDRIQILTGDERPYSDHFPSEWNIERIDLQSVVNRLPYHHYLGFYYPFLPYIVYRGLKMVRKMKPDVIMGMYPCVIWTYAAYLVAKLSGLPFVVNFHDAMLDGKSRPFERWIVARWERSVITGASSVCVLSGALRDLFRDRYGVIPTIVRHALPETRYVPARPLQKKKNEKLASIVLCGGVYNINQDAIRHVAEAVELLPEGTAILTLATPNTEAELAHWGIYTSKRVVRRFFTSTEEMLEFQAQADILVACVAFESDMPVEVNTAFPTRFIEYLIFGKPVLVHAPKVSYLARVAGKTGAAAVVEIPDVQFLADTIMSILSSPQRQKELGERALKLAPTFARSRASQRLGSALIGAASDRDLR